MAHCAQACRTDRGPAASRRQFGRLTQLALPRGMRAHLVTGNPGSGKSTLAAELSRRGLAAVDADELAYWEDSAGMPAVRPAGSGDDWLLAHRWVWSRSRIQQAIADSGRGKTAVLVCGVARNQGELLDMFHTVFLLIIDAQTPGTTACRGVPGPAWGSQAAAPRRPGCMPGAHAGLGSDPCRRDSAAIRPRGQATGPT